MVPFPMMEAKPIYDFLGLPLHWLLYFALSALPSIACHLWFFQKDGAHVPRPIFYTDNLAHLVSSPFEWLKHRGHEETERVLFKLLKEPHVSGKA